LAPPHTKAVVRTPPSQLDVFCPRNGQLFPSCPWCITPPLSAVKIISVLACISLFAASAAVTLPIASSIMLTIALKTRLV
jgi:hypothetical protein